MTKGPLWQILMPCQLLVTLLTTIKLQASTFEVKAWNHKKYPSLMVLVVLHPEHDKATPSDPESDFGLSVTLLPT